jgi:hypothetical protein
VASICVVVPAGGGVVVGGLRRGIISQGGWARFLKRKLRLKIGKGVVGLDGIDCKKILVEQLQLLIEEQKKTVDTKHIIKLSETICDIVCKIHAIFSQ